MVYNSETKTYDYHSQVDVVSTKPLQAEPNIKRKKQLKDKKVIIINSGVNEIYLVINLLY